MDKEERSGTHYIVTLGTTEKQDIFEMKQGERTTQG